MPPRPALPWCPSGATSSRATPRPPTRSRPSWPAPWRPPAATPPTTAGALVPWICDALLSNHSVKAYGRDLMDFLRHMQAQGVDPARRSPPTTSSSTSGPCSRPAWTSATVARRLSVLRGTYQQLAAKGLVSWETAQDIAAVKAPGVQKNSTPSLTQRQAIALLEAIPTDTLQGIRDLALMSVFFLTGCRVSAVTGACVGHLETDGVEHLPPRHREAEQEAAEDPARRRPAGPGLRRAGRHRGGQGGAALPAADAGRDAARSGGTWTARRPGGWSRNTAGPPASTPTGWAAAASASIACARRRSTTPSATGPRCTRCASSPATPTSAPPRSTSSARRKTPRWRPGGSRSASRDARASEPVAPDGRPSSANTQPARARFA